MSKKAPVVPATVTVECRNSSTQFEAWPGGSYRVEVYVSKPGQKPRFKRRGPSTGPSPVKTTGGQG
jgi:hypothetical protein